MALKSIKNKLNRQSLISISYFLNYCTIDKFNTSVTSLHRYALHPGAIDGIGDVRRGPGPPRTSKMTLEMFPPNSN